MEIKVTVEKEISLFYFTSKRHLSNEEVKKLILTKYPYCDEKCEFDYVFRNKQIVVYVSTKEYLENLKNTIFVPYENILILKLRNNQKGILIFNKNCVFVEKNGYEVSLIKYFNYDENLINEYSGNEDIKFFLYSESDNTEHMMKNNHEFKFEILNMKDIYKFAGKGKVFHRSKKNVCFYRSAIIAIILSVLICTVVLITKKHEKVIAVQNRNELLLELKNRKNTKNILDGEQNKLNTTRSYKEIILKLADSNKLMELKKIQVDNNSFMIEAIAFSAMDYLIFLQSTSFFSKLELCNVNVMPDGSGEFLKIKGEVCE